MPRSRYSENARPIQAPLLESDSSLSMRMSHWSLKDIFKTFIRTSINQSLQKECLHVGRFTATMSRCGPREEPPSTWPPQTERCRRSKRKAAVAVPTVLFMANAAANPSTLHAGALAWESQAVHPLSACLDYEELQHQSKNRLQDERAQEQAMTGNSALAASGRRERASDKRERHDPLTSRAPFDRRNVEIARARDV